MKIDLHIKGGAPGLTLKKRPEVIQKWPISNSNSTECSTIQGVIERVISKSNECAARVRFEITSTITL